MSPIEGAGEESTSAQSCADDHLASLTADGYVILRNVLSENLCDVLREHVLRTSDEGKRLLRSDLFGNIHEPDKRSDLKLDLCQPVVDSLNSFGERCGGLLTSAVGGRAKVVELAAITSCSGAVSQRVHADTMHGINRFLSSEIEMPSTVRERTEQDSEDEDGDEDLGNVLRAVATETAKIYTSLIALQDITTDMGPTHVWPGTHTVQHHATLLTLRSRDNLSVAEADKAFSVEHKKMALSKGDLVLYDSRVMHCGGANFSDTRRSVMCISVMGPGFRPDGSTWSLLHSLRNQMTLDRLPLSKNAVTARANTADYEDVVLPPPSEAKSDDEPKIGKSAASLPVEMTGPKEIPPLEDWAAAVQCTLCSRWRPSGEDEACKLTALEHGFRCPILGFSCVQEQGYTDEEIDALF